jgi:hypothetical protein
MEFDYKKNKNKNGEKSLLRNFREMTTEREKEVSVN